MKILFTIFSFFVLLIASEVNAVTWYVNQAIGSDGNSCAAAQSPSTPKASISSAFGCVGTAAGDGAGDTVEVAAGTYVENWFGNVPSGSSWSLPFTFKAKTGDVATIAANSASMMHIFATRPYFLIIDGFVFDGVNLSENFLNFGGDGTGPSDIRVQNNEFKNIPFQMAIFIGRIATNIVISGNYIHDAKGGAVNQFYGIYLEGPNNVIENNWLENLPSYGLHIYSGYPEDPDNAVIRGNVIKNAASFHSAPGIGVFEGDNIQVYNNITYGMPGKQGIVVSWNATNTKVYNNTSYGNGMGIQSEIVAANGIFRNNIAYGNTTDMFIEAPGDVYSNNLCGVSGLGCTATGNPNFIDAANANFGLTASSTNAINQGTASIATGVTRSFNGSAPDLGAHETFLFSSCSVESGDASTLRIVFENNVYPPIAGISTAGFTYRINAGSSNNPNAAASGGTNQINLTLQSAVTAGQTIDFSYTTAGSVRDSANIGGALAGAKNQRLNAITNQSCQNNVSGGGPSGLTVSHFRFHNMRSSSTSTPEASRYLLAATDTNTSVMPGAVFAVRTKVKCTGGDCPSTAVNLRYQKNGTGGYINVPDTCGADNIQFIGTSNTSADIPAQGTMTTEQLTSDFATNVAGAIARTSSAIPNLDLSQDSETEVEHLIQICSGATLGHYYEFRPYKQDGTALDAYTVTPKVTLANARFWQ